MIRRFSKLTALILSLIFSHSIVFAMDGSREKRRKLNPIQIQLPDLPNELLIEAGSYLSTKISDLVTYSKISPRFSLLAQQIYRGNIDEKVDLRDLSDEEVKKLFTGFDVRRNTHGVEISGFQLNNKFIDLLPEDLRDLKISYAEWTSGQWNASNWQNHFNVDSQAFSLLKRFKNLQSLELVSGISGFDLSFLQERNIRVDFSSFIELPITRLNLKGVLITDLPPHAALINLTHLEISHTQVVDLSPLVGLTQLTSLKLNGSPDLPDLFPPVSFSLSLASTLGELKGLTQLMIKDISLVNIPNLTALENLTELEITGTQVTDLSPLANLISLKSLVLGRSLRPKITDLSPLAGLKNLNSLSIIWTRADIAPLVDLPSLKHLELISAFKDDIDSLPKFTQLTFLSLLNSHINDISNLDKLTNLTSLNISNTQVTDISPLYRLKNLTDFRIWNCKKVPNRQLERLKKLLPKCQISSNR
jgi:Leucine-rich repeat (LRR) protein